MKYILIAVLLVLPFASFAYTCPGDIQCGMENGMPFNQWGDAPRVLDPVSNFWFVDITGTDVYKEQMTKLGNELRSKGQCALFPMFAVWCK